MDYDPLSVISQAIKDRKPKETYSWQGPGMGPLTPPMHERMMSRTDGANQQTKNRAYMMSQMVPLDYEGILQAYALKHGAKKTRELVLRLHHDGYDLNTLMQKYKDLGQAGRESDYMDWRESNRAKVLGQK
jgi:hypothetical protein